MLLLYIHAFQTFLIKTLHFCTVITYVKNIQDSALCFVLFADALHIL